MIIKREKRIGETRYAVIKGKDLLSLDIERASETGRPRHGDIYAGRVTKIEKSVAAAFVDLGVGPSGFLNFTLAGNAPRLTEGMIIEVVIIREAEAEKGPLLRFVATSDAKNPGPLATMNTLERLQKQYPGAELVDADIPQFDAYLSSEFALHEGGYLYVERTRAATSFDIDVSQGRSKRDVSIAAAKTIANLLRVRNIGGLVLIDFPNFRKTRDRNAVWNTLSDRLEIDHAVTKLDPMSRFGAVLLTRQKTGRSMTQILHDETGQPTDETLALDALNRLVREGRANPGAQLTLTLPDRARNWLDAHTLIWQEPLKNEIGARYSIETGDAIDVKRDRPA